MTRSWGGYLAFILVFAQAGSEWLNCPQECHCKWSAGKRTALCDSAGLKQLPNLAADIQVLDLHGNPLKKLERDAFLKIGLVNLQSLNLSLTSLESLHENAFRHLEILVLLDLSQNQILQLSPDMFKGLDNLRLLILNDNPLSVIIAEQFPPLRRLKQLEISRCKLQTVHPFAFIHLQSLETVKIHHNFLSYLHQNTFNLPVLKTLTLSDNPWYCDCRLREFHDWFLNSDLGNEEVSCRGPEMKAEMSWRVLKRDDFVCPPSATSSPTVIRTEPGAKISFGCFVRGEPKPTVSWSFHHIEINNSTDKDSDIMINKYQMDNFDEYNDDFLNKNAHWVNLTITNVTSDLFGKWKCSAKSPVGEANAHLSLLRPKARTTTVRVAPECSIFYLFGGSLLAVNTVGLMYMAMNTRTSWEVALHYPEEVKRVF